jgi:hypothetical protein
LARFLSLWNEKRATTPTNPSCGENDGTGDSEELKPDCGTKTVTKWPLELLYDEDEKNAIILGSGNGEDPFENCPRAGGTLSFPYKGSTKYVGDDFTTKDKLEWDVSFTRLGGSKQVEERPRGVAPPL